MTGSHWKHPHLGSDSAFAGALENIPLEIANNSDWSVYFNDFTNIDNDYVTTTDWSLTQVSAGGSASVLVDAGTADIGVLRLDCPADEDGPILQYDGSGAAGTSPLGVTPAAAVAGTSIASDAVFGARFRVLDVSAQGIFVGLAELNGSSAVIATPEGAITSDTHIGFSKTDADVGSLTFTASGDADTTADTTTGVATLTDSSWIEVACRATGVNRARGYVRLPGQNTGWKQVADVAMTTDWDAQMLITLANIGAGTGDDLDIDYVWLAVRRELTA